MTRLMYLGIAVLFLSVVNVASSHASGIGYFSESIMQLHENAQLAIRSESLEGLQEHARIIMAMADAFQQQAQQVNDQGFVNEAVDIYNSAYRASKSSSLEEARSYAREIVSHTAIVSEQSGVSHHNPYLHLENQEENWGEIMDEQYGKSM